MTVDETCLRHWKMIFSSVEVAAAAAVAEAEIELAELD